MRKNKTNQRTGRYRCTSMDEYMTDSHNVHGRKFNSICPICGFTAAGKLYVYGDESKISTQTHLCPTHRVELVMKSCKFEMPRKGSNKFKKQLKNKFKLKIVR